MKHVEASLQHRCEWEGHDQQNKVIWSKRTAHTCGWDLKLGCPTSAKKAPEEERELTGPSTERFHLLSDCTSLGAGERRRQRSRSAFRTGSTAIVKATLPTSQD